MRYRSRGRVKISTIEDIAKLAGVSKATVSRVINHHPYVRSELRERVQAIIDEKNYVPVAVAKDLRRLQTNLIGVVVPNLHHPFFGKLIQEISNILKEDCYDVVILQSNYAPEREREFIHYVRTKKLDGLIFTTLSLSIEEVECVSTSGMIVICNEHVETELISTVQFDEERAGYLGTKHLLEKGYTRIAFCYDTLKSKAQRKRYKGYKKALCEHHLSLQQEWIFRNCYGLKDGKRMIQMMQSMKNAPDAMFTGSDEIAAGMIMEAQRMGICIPKDFGVIGFDNQELSVMMSPSITTVSTSIASMAKHSIILLHKQSQGEGVQKVQLPISVIERESTRREEGHVSYRPLTVS
ncbi:MULTISPECIES: LacI family DNA-binding transcriptional regulator [unclassified Bacillus (in: firmicutes)]|uniref:LacI family DNA-binding transcriptional regulator n=1 Tax=unclassified Bacillus (in: firmicutes) TaxID=185979 RepID=UPI0008EFBB5F|nr:MULTISPECIES: LacI family DNA-binding transcriptional regulator [unclassified Bacillus (in: firmicutes)]SFJ36799.1 DNA-binding transcriptional regulator, LacI/PurR family [Bacillus sp. 71mf]SFS51499.1 DNA-binding transcriptional regulator, LacI/PurR family [Bacillus sp. 103mf]